MLHSALQPTSATAATPRWAPRAATMAAGPPAAITACLPASLQAMFHSATPSPGSRCPCSAAARGSGRPAAPTRGCNATPQLGSAPPRRSRTGPASCARRSRRQRARAWRSQTGTAPSPPRTRLQARSRVPTPRHRVRPCVAHASRRVPSAPPSSPAPLPARRRRRTCRRCSPRAAPAAEAGWGRARPKRSGSPPRRAGHTRAPRAAVCCAWRL
jgi:hypothetical protein